MAYIYGNFVRLLPRYESGKIEMDIMNKVLNQVLTLNSEKKGLIFASVIGVVIIGVYFFLAFTVQAGDSHKTDIFRGTNALPKIQADKSKTIEARLSSWRGSYIKSLQKLTTSYKEKKEVLPNQYVKALKAIQQKKQKTGDLEGWTLIEHELRRFEESRSVLKNAVVEEPAELKTLQVQYQNAIAKYDMASQKKILALNRKYISYLTTLKNNLMVERKIEDARLVNDEIKWAQSDPEIAEAEMYMSIAMYQETTHAEETQGDETEEVDPDEDQTSQQRNRYGRPEEQEKAAKIYKGQQPPKIPGVGFKDLKTYITDTARHIRVLSGGFKLGSASHEQTHSGSYRGSWSSAKSQEKKGVTEHYVRVKLKSVRVKSTISGTKLVLQYFVKDIGSKNLDTKPIAVKHIDLPDIDIKGIYVDCPPVITYRRVYKYSSGSSRYKATSKRGCEFYGLIVSVVDSDGSVIFQKASKGSLRKLATATIPEKASDKQELRERYEYYYSGY